jgi:hypothetical protein
MDEIKLAGILANALGTGAATAAVLIILWRVLSRIAERWIAALDSVTKGMAALDDSVDKSLREHTATDLAHHADVKESVVRVEAKLDSALDWLDRTPVGDRPASKPRRAIRTNPQGYRPPKPGHHDE